MEGGGRCRWHSSLVGGGSLCLWGLVVHPWGIVVVGEQVAAVPGLCCAHLVVAVVIFICARAGHYHAHAGRHHARAGCCGTCSGCCCGHLVILVVVLGGAYMDGSDVVVVGDGGRRVCCDCVW